MNYNELKQITKNKNILVKDLASEIGITRQGLQKVLDNETIELKLVKRICDVLRISPALFFEGSFGLSVSPNNTDLKKELESKQNEINSLRERLEDKNEIISMLRDKLDLGIAASPKIQTYKKK